MSSNSYLQDETYKYVSLKIKLDNSCCTIVYFHPLTACIPLLYLFLKDKY